MSTGIFPEKFAMYFANMNSLSGKIYSDVVAVEESLPGGLSYSEKCAVLDKYLIHDVLTTTTQKSQSRTTSGGTVSKNCNGNGVHAIKKDTNQVWIDPDFDQDQLRTLLLAVHPKPPEKYVFEENGVWVDEHSQPFSFCKQSQVKGCRLGELIKNLPAGELPTDVATTTKSNHQGNKINENKIVAESDDEPVPEPKIKAVTKKTKAAPSFFGVNVMGFMGENQNAAAVKIPTGKNDPGKEDAIDGGDGEESNLPKQKQNLELIAELQAKLKKTNSGGKAGISHVQLSKVSKPKAPPPPPPAVVQDVSSDEIKNSTLVENEASVDQKVKETNKQEEKVEAKTTVEKELRPSSKSPLLLHQNLKSNASGAGSKEQEFCVDVSSPCRIATPKTGLDFLDNW